MNEPTEPQLDPRKVRIGLVIISIVVIGAGALFVMIEDPLGRAVMFAVAALGFVRAFLLTRSLRRG